MRRAISLVFLCTIALTVYGASPFVAGWRLREAIGSGDTAYVEQKVEWARVRATFKASLSRHAELLPAMIGKEHQPPTFWQRAKAVLGQSVVDRFVESYITPSGLAQLYAYRKAWRHKVKGEPDERQTLAWYERMQRFYARLKRAEFQSPTRIEFEMADRDNPERRYVSVMELIGFEWKMTSLTIRVVDAASRLSELERSGS
jgi:hypothetical protein